ncbi:MAG: hypothetical protein M1837_007401 [Sclerophora amabilis]|nr:MAG: hypothetical protein M1837_007401 [Sclerophora amabilis]
MQLLSRLQQQEELRMAEIEDLTKCPFCDFAAVCEPVEVDREFSCQAEECMRVTCRLCQKESHLPLSCEDNSKENHITIRHALEEARTEALVRSCRKCQNKFIKESGCNKMTCPRCRNVQCYICNKSINHYSHFAERSTQADSSGLCPLYDDTDQRHEKEVADAEKVALEKLKKADPNIEEEKLKIQVSKAVMMDDQKRRLGGKNRPGNGGPIIPNPGAAPHPMNPAARNANAGYQRPARQQYDGAFDFDLDAGPPNDLPFFDIVQHLDFAQDVPGTVNGQPHPHSRPPANLQLDDGRYRARAHIPPQNAYLPFQHLPHLPFHLRAAGVRPPIRESGMQRNPILIADHDQQARVPTNEAARGTVRQPYEYNPQMDRVQPTNQVHIPPYPARGFAQAQDAQLPQAENYNARTHMAHEIQNPRRNAIAEQDLIMPAPFLTGQRLHGDPDRLWL